MEKFEVAVDQLLLDLQNPRIGEVETQPEALRAMIEFDPKHFRTMMESIKDHGLDPGDAFYLINSESDPDDFIVVDGNRRLSALKVLRTPTLLQGIPIAESLRARLAKAAEGFDPKGIETVDAVLFESRAGADEWILRRHGRAMEGEGRIYWGTLEIQRFQGDRTVLDVIDFLRRNSTFSEERWRHIDLALSGKAYVLRRFLDAKPIKELLGFSTSGVDGETVPSFSADPETALQVLSGIAEGIADGALTTRTHNRKEDFVDYVEQLPVGLKGGKGPGKPQRFRDVDINGGTRPRQKAKEQKRSAETKSTKSKPPRATLAPRKHRFAEPPSEKGQRLLYEASRISLKDLPLASAYVFRAFIEHAIDGYLNSHKISDWNAPKQQRHDLKGRANLVFEDAKSRGLVTRQDLRGVERILTNPQDPASIQALNDYHHNIYHLPSSDILRTAWDSAEPLFLAIFGKPSA